MANLPCQAPVADLWGHLIISGLFCRSSPSTSRKRMVMACHGMAWLSSQQRRWQRQHATNACRDELLAQANDSMKWGPQNRIHRWFKWYGTEKSWTIYHILSSSIHPGLSPTNCNTLRLGQIKFKRLHHLKERQIKFKRNKTSDIRRLFLGLRICLCFFCTARQCKILTSKVEFVDFVSHGG